jgi:hypothetical protein
MVTSNAAEMLRLEYGAGQVTESGVANMIAVRRTRNETPASILSKLTYNEIELVVRSGQVEMASPAIYERLPQDRRKDMQLLEVADNSRWLRAPLKSLVEEAESILGRGNLRVAGRQVRYAGSI